MKKIRVRREREAVRKKLRVNRFGPVRALGVAVEPDRTGFLFCCFFSSSSSTSSFWAAVTSASLTEVRL